MLRSAAQNGLVSIYCKRGQEEQPMRRAFRVAATFAGTVAGASAFVPAAGAATAIPHRPDIILNNCKAGESHFVHIYFSPGAHHGPQCLGYNGVWTFPGTGTEISSICAGNNYLWFEISDSWFHLSPGQASGFVSGARLDRISITGHTGNATCPS
jgi:hypothetical protein